jgi:hypothetical protein
MNGLIFVSINLFYKNKATGLGMPVILATQEAEIRKMAVQQSQSREDSL